jgi:Tol biopolymer transport system component
MRRGLLLAAITCLSAGCHSEPFTPTAYALGPNGSGADIRLTWNPEQTYWPVWTDDGRGIIYSFVAPGQPLHRCLGMLPANGGTDVWQLCDNRTGQEDSTSTFPGYALSQHGQLLYVEATAARGYYSKPVLWLADTARPFVRASLASLPIALGPLTITWLTELTWVDSTSFLALGQHFSEFSHCQRCAQVDTVFDDAGAVVAGTIRDGRATLQVVAGTLGATDYSLAESGSSIVFTLPDNVVLYRVPLSGGTPIAVDTVASSGDQLVGVSCKASMCLVGVDSLRLSGTNGDVTDYPVAAQTPRAIVSVTLNTAGVQTLYTATDIVSTPRISPASGDVVVQIGGVWAHLQTFGAATSDLHLLRGLVQ